MKSKNPLFKKKKKNSKTRLTCGKQKVTENSNAKDIKTGFLEPGEPGSVSRPEVVTRES